MTLGNILLRRLLRPASHRPLGLLAVIWTLVVLFGFAGLTFAVAGLFLSLADALGPANGALVTAALLLILALCLAAGAIAGRRRSARKDPDIALLVAAGLLAGLAGLTRTADPADGEG